VEVGDGVKGDEKVKAGSTKGSSKGKVRGGLTNKERVKIKRQKMPEQDPNVRKTNFDEVALGLTDDIALLDAQRCIQCKKKPCIDGCPVRIDIPAFILAFEEGDLATSAKILKDANSLPAICGRVCPQETQCELVCTTGKKFDPVAIGHLERYVSDWERINLGLVLPDVDEPTGRKVAIIGSGPAGLTAAGDLAKKGHEVVIYEALHKAGGVMRYGIPSFRLPRDILDGEIDYLKALGVKIFCNVVVGKAFTVDDLLKDYDAVFVGTGAGLPWFMRIPGENLKGVYSANEYLTRIILMGAHGFPENDTPVVVGKKVAVIGGGNTAMDACRVSLRMGAEHVYCLYRRSRKELPARIEEIDHAEEEGVDFNFLTAPVEFYGDDEGWLTGAKCVRMELGEPDSSGRRRPVVIEGSEFEIELDTVVEAIGFGANPLVPQTTPGLETNKWGIVVADEATGKTSRERVYAGGDIITGGSTVISERNQHRLPPRNR
jgi:glutamate synthase (NADPH/NADH) small chain